MPMDLRSFCEGMVLLRGRPFSLADRPYLQAVYGSTARRLVLRASRQVEKTTLLANRLIYHAVTQPGIRLIYVCPRREQALVFSKSRLLPLIESSRVIRRILLGKQGRRPQVMNLQFHNQSEIYIRAAYHSADAARGIDGDVLVVDEFQDIAAGHLPVLEESLSHSPLRQVILAGTPKTVDNHLEAVFGQSSACEFLVACPDCGAACRLDEHCLGPCGPVCAKCQAALDPRCGQWVARNPTATWGEGFWINHLMVPWLHYAELLEKQRTYDPARFKNECLGLPTLLGEYVVTRAELEACCEPRAMVQTYADIAKTFPPRLEWHEITLVAGIDWGGGGSSRTAFVLGYLRPDGLFTVLRFERFAASDEPDYVLKEVAERCQRFGVHLIGADGGGNGTVYNRLLLDRLQQLSARTRRSIIGVLYSASDHPPVRDGPLLRWTVQRTGTLATVFTLVKKRRIRFPRVEAIGTFLDEFACEYAEYDTENRTIRYCHPETQPDDCLHATNYALLAAGLHMSQQDFYAAG